MPLTATAVKNAKQTEKPQRLWDERGLYLEISPRGGKWWRLKYRVGGKEKRISLGTWPDTSLAEARDKRDEARKLISKGIDPSEQRKADDQAEVLRDSNSFSVVALEWHEKRSPKWVQDHSDDVLRRLKTNLFPDLGDRPIAEIDALELLTCVRKVEARGAHDLAHRLLGVAGQVFRYGVATSRCGGDPSRDLRGALTTHKPKKQNAIKLEQFPALLRAMATYDTIGDRQTTLALRLLCLTFVRTTELIQAEWSEIHDLDGTSPTWTVPASRMKMGLEHVVPLAPQSVVALQELQVLAVGSAFVFPGREGLKPISNNTMLFALYRLGYKGRMTGHGFRAVASSALNEAGFRPDVIERQLAHIERNKVRAAYHRSEYLPERRDMMNQWANMVDAYASGADVVPLRRAG